MVKMINPLCLIIVTKMVDRNWTKSLIKLEMKRTKFLKRNSYK